MARDKIPIGTGILSLFREGGINISFKDVHPLKGSDPTSDTYERNVTFAKDEHRSKAEEPILVTEKGIVICVNEKHPENSHQ